MKDSAKQKARFTANCTVLLAFFVALFFPLGYFIVSYQYTIGGIETEAKISAQLFAGLHGLKREQWQDEAQRLHVIISHDPSGKDQEQHRLLDPVGEVLAEGGHEVPKPLVTVSEAIVQDGRKVGSIEISRSVRPLLKKTGLLAFLGLSIGLIVFILLPFRAINRANRQLQDSYSFLTKVMESSANLLVVLDLENAIGMVNGRCEEVTGYGRDELAGMRFDALIAAGSVRHVLDRLQMITSGSSELVKFEADLLKKDGSVIAIGCGATPVYEEGQISGVVLSVENVTERRLAVEQLKAAKEYTENLIQAACVMILGLDVKGRVTLFNRTSEEVTGYGAFELIGKNWFETVMGGEAFYSMCTVPSLTQETAKGSVCENQIVTREGTVRTISWRNCPIVEKGATVGTLCFGIDITEHRKIEAQLRHSQKMESVGQLVGGVAHDFNNMLSVILGYAQLCQIEAAQDSPTELYLQEILKAGERSRDMVRKLLAFSRKEIISPRAVNLNDHCMEMEKTLSRLIGEEIRLNFMPAAGLWSVKIDPSQVDQILMNLAVNARDAMPHGGRLTVKSENASVDSAFCDYRLDARPGDYVCLTVQDTGTGMDRELLKRIFEPFFTTKEVGRGTGLGLATVYGIVTQNEGFIDVESEPGRGTAFKIYLPRLSEEPETEPKATPPVLKGSGTVLVVEDDSMLRLMATQMLETIGYRVIQAESPHLALSICGDPETQIDLILSDVVMPEMNGIEMAKEIELLRPETKVLFMTGYSSDAISQRGTLDDLGIHFLQKPFDMEGLQTKIMEIQQN